MRLRLGSVPALGLLVALPACGGEVAPETVLTFDSAGISVVESLSPRWGEDTPWVVEPVPLLDLAASGNGPQYEFHRVRDATRLEDGSLAVVNEGSAEVRFYTSSGTFSMYVGGKGEGPGEFQRPISVQQYLADSLIVFDYWSRRLTVLDRSHVVSRTATFSTPFANELRALPDGRVLLSVNSLLARDASVGRTRVPQPFILASPIAEELDTVVVVPGHEEFVFEEGSGIPPLARTGSSALLGQRLVTSDGEGVVLRVYSLEGALESVFRIRDHPLVAPEAVRDSIRKALLGSQGPEFIRAAAREMSTNIPDRFPGVMDIIVDSRGYLWAAEYSPRQVSSQPRGWLVFDTTGAWMGRVELPSNFDAYEIGHDYVLGRQRNELDVETVRLLGLRRP